MLKKYEEAILEIVVFPAEDIVTASVTDGGFEDEVEL